MEESQSAATTTRSESGTVSSLPGNNSFDFEIFILKFRSHVLSDVTDAEILLSESLSFYFM